MLSILTACQFLGEVRAQEPSPDTSDAAARVYELNERIGRLQQAGRYEEAQPLAEEAVSMAEKHLGAEHMETARSLNNQAVGFQALGDLKGARACLTRALAIEEKARGPESPRLVKYLCNLAGVLHAMHEDAGARPLFERALAIEEKRLGPDHLDLVTLLQDLTIVLEAVGDRNGARDKVARILALQEHTLGPESLDIAATLTELGSLLHSLGDFAGARPLLERALLLKERSLGPEHAITARGIQNLAAILFELGDLKGARPLFERALAIWEKTLGTEDPETAASLDQLAITVAKLGDLRGARTMFERVLATRERVLGREHPETATSLHNLAAVLQTAGDLRAARPLLERALAIRKTALGEEAKETALTLNSLADLTWKMGDVKAAREFLERALAIDEKVYGPEHPATATELSNLGCLLKELGDSKAARKLVESALAIEERTLGPEHPNTGVSLHHLGNLLMDAGDLQGARPLLERALAISEKALGPEHPHTASDLNSLALLLQALGDAKGALTLFERGLCAYEKSLGPEHWDTVTNVGNLAQACQALGDTERARGFGERAWQARRRFLHALFSCLSSRERVTALAQHDSDLAQYLHRFRDDPVRTYAAALGWKGIALRAGAATQRLPDDAPPEARTAAIEVFERRARLARLAFESSAPSTNEPTLAARAAALSRDIEGFERRLAELLPDFAARAFLEVSPEDVRRALPEDAALLDLLENQGRLHAWVIRAGREVEYFDLGKANVAARLTDAFRGALMADDETAWSREGGALRDLLEAPLASALAGTHELYLSPDGALATVPLGLLPDISNARADGATPSGTAGPGPRFLLERIPVTQVNGGAGFVMATRMHLRAAPSSGVLAGGLLALGGVDYDRAEGATAIPCPRSQALWAPLAETRPEAEAVGRRFAAAFPSAPVTLLTGPAATEAAFVRAASRARVIHAATHGYFDIEGLRAACAHHTRGFVQPMAAAGLPPQPVSGAPSVADPASAPAADASPGLLRIPKLGLGRADPGWNPLLLSGLVLAGANRREEGAAGDGWLSAEELQGLDLTGTELVVLSACETGRGELAAGEGVLGLSRALVLAGARRFLLSLWKVPDRDTRELMDDFYARLWPQGAATVPSTLSPENALRTVQLARISAQRTAKRFRPSTWGAWVVTR